MTRSKYLKKVQFSTEMVASNDYDLVYYATDDDEVGYRKRTYLLVTYDNGTKLKIYNIQKIEENTINNKNTVISVNIPKSCTSIGDKAFYGCTTLETITIPNNITEIGTSVFVGCTNLHNLDYLASNVTLTTDITGPLSNVETVTLGDNIQLGTSVFAPTASTLKEINGVINNVPNALCMNCSQLTQVTLSDDVTTIGTQAFYGCSSLTEITIPSNVTSIAAQAFGGCTGIHKLNYLASNVTLTTALTASLPNAETITLGNNIQLGEGVFVPIATNLKEINGTINNVPNDAFMGCSNITHITLSDSVTSIGNRAFNSCSSLTNIVLPNSVTSINDGAFYGCKQIQNINLPSSIHNIGNAIFADCTLLANINYNSNIDDWNAITKDSGWNADSNITQIICTDGTINL